MTTATQPLIAYHGSQAEKDAILAQLEQHRKADQIIKGTYWQNGKGCAVGCTIYSDDHYEYEPRFGIPQALARLEDRIFEGLPNDLAMDWPQRFMGAIRPGADLTLVHWQCLHDILTDEAITPGINHPLVKEPVAQVARLCAAWANGDPIDRNAAEIAAESAWSAAESAAESAARSAESAVGSAACAAKSAACAAESAWSAAESPAESAARSAESAWIAAEGGAWIAAEGGAWIAAEGGAKSAAYVKMADLLISLLEAA